MLEKIIELTADTLGANVAEITAETSFMDDLHADSLDLFELAMALEEEFSVEIPSEDLEKITTVADAMNYLTDILRQWQDVSRLQQVSRLVLQFLDTCSVVVTRHVKTVYMHL